MPFHELSRKIEGNYISIMNRENPLKNAEDLYKLLKLWKQLTNGNTIGDLTIHNGNTPIILLEMNRFLYYINADTTRKGVAEFLVNREDDWSTIMNSNGKMNKITNTKNKESIEGFYMYKRSI